MQSVVSRLFMGALRGFFHSPLSDSSMLSKNVSKMANDRKIRYKPSRGFAWTRHTCNGVKYEKLVNKVCRTDKVILMLHGGSFRTELTREQKKTIGYER